MKYAKAVVSAVVTLAAYLVGVIPAEGSFGDVSLVQWLGGVVFLGASYGLTAATYNRQPDVLVRLRAGQLIAGDGAPQPTGQTLSPLTTLGDVTPTGA